MNALTLINPAYENPELLENSNGRFTRLDDLKDPFAGFRDRPFRDTQIMALDFLVKAKKRFVVIEAPCGSGKSLLGMAASQLARSSVYTVHSKILQVQLQQDFPEAAVLFGRSNYPCSMSVRFTCAECPLLNPAESCTRGCPYKAAKVKAIAAQFRVLNYSYLLSEINFVGRFSKQGLIVIDEADSLEQTLYDFVSISISESRLKAMHMTFPKHKTAGSEVLVEEWREWAGQVKRKVDARVKQMTATIETWEEAHTEEEQKFLKQLESLHGLQSKLSIFLTHVDQSWQSEIKEGYRGGKTIHFKPLWLTKSLCEEKLWRHADRFLLMSATFPPLNVLGRMLGIDPDEINYLTLPSTFPVENRKCFIVPSANITHKTIDEEMPKLIKVVKKIMAKHPDEKGLIHSVSYKIAIAIMREIDDPRLITHDSFNKQEIINSFRESDQPLVLVSPSSERGLSLENAMCRFVVLCKAPYLSLADKAVRARVYSGQVGQLWYQADAALTICQSCGRAVRSETDWAVAYLLDDQIAKLITSKPTLLPPWFRDSLDFMTQEELFGPDDAGPVDNEW